MLGNEAFARGLYEAGCKVVSSYPGTPSTEITEEVAKYNQLVLNHSISPLENPSQIKAARRTIAQMKTVLREIELNK